MDRTAQNRAAAPELQELKLDANRILPRNKWKGRETDQTQETAGEKHGEGTPGLSRGGGSNGKICTGPAGDESPVLGQGVPFLKEAGRVESVTDFCF